jgi:class 3 adenylate cyclase
MTIALSRIEVEQLRQRLYSLFGRYVDENIRDIILERGGVVSERKRLCVLFSDIKNFTPLCERNDPENITGMLNAFFDEWNSLVKKHDGTVDKYIGDAIMVFFGLQGDANPCDSAALCAMEMDRKWESVKAVLMKQGLPVPEDFGIGVHYGEVIVGDIGSSDRKNFTIIGDTVNIASRLEAETRNHKGRLLISSSVYKELGESNRNVFHEIGDIELKGKEKRIRAFLYDEART